MTSATEPALNSHAQAIAAARGAFRAGRWDEAAQAARVALQHAPRDLSAMLLLGEAHHHAGRVQEAGQAFTLALRLAGQGNPASLPAPVQMSLKTAQERLGTYAAQYEAFLGARLSGHETGPRFRQALELLFGRARIFHQQPTRFYYPGLPQIAFYEREDFPALFPWASALEAQTDTIRGELLAVMADHAAFRPYVQADHTRPHLRDSHMTGNADWSAFYLWKDGAPVAESAARCPGTMAALEHLPFDRIAGQAPSVLFSLLRPGARIPPHHGLINTRVVCHLPLLVPGPAWLRVGAQTRHWREGELMIFDDSFEHEACNEADGTRVVLLFDVWRPEITKAEQVQIAALLGAISDYAGTRVLAGE